MFLRKTGRRKDGKTHLYWSVVENRRLDSGRVVQRHVLYLGEINSSQAEAWRRAIEVFDEDAGAPRSLSLFSDERCDLPAADASIVRLRLGEMRLCRPRQWGACWLAGVLWRELQLDRFWADRLPGSRKGTRWADVLQVLVTYRLISPGSEWRLHRQWFLDSAIPKTLGRHCQTTPGSCSSPNTHGAPSTSLAAMNISATPTRVMTILTASRRSAAITCPGTLLETKISRRCGSPPTLTISTGYTMFSGAAQNMP